MGTTKEQSTPPLLFTTAVQGDNVRELSLSTVVDAYSNFYAAGDSHTARAKRNDLSRFLRILSAIKRSVPVENLKVGDWDFSNTQLFVDELLKRGEAPATAARRLATIKHMGRMLAERIPGFINPARDVKAPKVQVLKPKAVSATELAAVKERAQARIIEKPGFMRARNAMLVNFLVDTGLRADEVRTLRLGQLDEDLRWIDQVRTKGRRFRRVYITSEIRAALKDYLEKRKHELSRHFPKLPQNIDLQLPLFISTYKVSPADTESFVMSPKSVWRAVRDSSTETKLHPHLLRHTYATDLLETSKDVRLVAQALGHSDVRITMRYTERVDEELARALEETRNKKREKKRPVADDEEE